MEIRTIGGRRATNRRGAAEYLGIPLNTVRIKSSPAQRGQTGWPEPLGERLDDQDWFALDDLDAYRKRSRPVLPPPPQLEDPERVIGVSDFARLRDIALETIKTYVKLSLDDWLAGRPGYLPRPLSLQAPYQWRLGDAVAWSFPTERRTSSGRPPGRRPTTADLRRVLAATAAGEPKPTARQLAALLSAEFDPPVSLQTVYRLIRRLRQENDAAARQSGD
ncbi:MULTISPECIES: helix-turn-helix domain-containing protein [Micromonospora]|uniref:helix-turn-helix domain-containing protein n=1 Tax=Micromonospora TaxID=1873 RepID=UPI0011AEF488|nr:helix-turn-helix domain-containing protein [Verrucosispora sp. ts21]